MNTTSWTNPVSVTVWWTPDCGYLHCETDPATIPFQCPEGVHPDDASTPQETVP